MGRNRALELPDQFLLLRGDGRPVGTRVLEGLLHLAGDAMTRLKATTGSSTAPVAAVGRLRGTGLGVHFSRLVAALEAEHPIRMTSPFEGSPRVSGGVWIANSLLGADAALALGGNTAMAKLHWDKGADDLPIHVHDYSDRFIIVLQGRGYFHVADGDPASFNGTGVRTVPARERDIFAFTRGLLHTFSTLDHPMTLLSCQLPYLEFEDPDQYRLPPHRWTAREHPQDVSPLVAIDPAWSLIAGC